MNKEQLNLVMEKIGNHFKNSSKRPVVVFHASEPLLVKDIIFEAMDKFKKQFYFGLQTNALLLEETDVEFLKNHRVGVGISLDSLDPDINDRQRPYKKGNGNFAKAVEAIDMNSKPFKEIRSRVVEKIEECSVCNFRNICGAPCPAELYSLGEMYQPAVFCEFYKEIIRYAFKLIAEDKVKYLLREESLKGLKYVYKY